MLGNNQTYQACLHKTAFIWMNLVGKYRDLGAYWVNLIYISTFHMVGLWNLMIYRSKPVLAVALD